MRISSKLGITLLISILTGVLTAQSQGSGSAKATPPKADSVSSADIWLNTVWKDIDAATTTKSYEVEKVTTVAGVRGAEAEDEATKQLYFRGTKALPDQAELTEKIQQLQQLIAADPTRAPEFEHYIIQCYLQLDKPETVAALTKEYLAKYPTSPWARFYR